MIYIFKRGFDFVVSSFALLLLAPLFLVIGFLVRLDGGPAFYYATRAGRDRQPIRIPKFRSMIVDADKYLDSGGRPTRDRVTRIGKYIRRFSLDELPQLFSVLTGKMSLVGPRPILVSDAEQIRPEFLNRFQVRPGITGLAQVSGRNSLPWIKRYELDCRYVEKLSIWNDLKILAKTFGVVIGGSGMSMDRNPDEVRS